MEASKIKIDETIPASRKLQADDARELLNKASKLTVAKGKKVQQFSAGKKASDDALESMLGPTGNLRAPTMKIGKTLVVGYNEEVFEEVFG